MVIFLLVIENKGFMTKICKKKLHLINHALSNLLRNLAFTVNLTFYQLNSGYNSNNGSGMKIDNNDGHIAASLLILIFTIRGQNLLVKLVY